MTVLTWDTAEEFNQGVTQDGVAHDVIAGNVADTLRLGTDNAEYLPHRGVHGWHNRPGSVRYSGTKDQTYDGVVNEDGDVVISAYNHSTGEWTHSVLNAALDISDHSSPAILVRDSDARIIVFYSGHNLDRLVRYRVSTNAEDISAFDAEQTITVVGTSDQTSYVAPRQAANGDIYVFYNPNVDDDWEYVKSTDGGATWGASQPFIDAAGSRCYIHLGFWNNGRMDVSVSRVAADPVEDNIEDMAHCYFDGASIYDTAGNVLNSGSLPVADTTIISDADSIIWDSSAQTKPRARTYDCASFDDGAGNPRPEVLFVVYDQTGNTSTEYKWARHNGTSWDVQTIPETSTSQHTLSDPAVSIGQSGGLSLDHSTPGKVLLAELPNDRDHSIIKEAVTTDNGASWTVTTIVPEGPTTGQVRYRPVYPQTPNDLTLGPHADISRLWSVGTYSSLDTYYGVVEAGEPGMHEPVPAFFFPCNETSGNAKNRGIAGPVPEGVVNGTTTSFYGATGVIGRNAFTFNGTDNYLSLTGSKDWALWANYHVKFGTVAIAFKTSSTALGSLLRENNNANDAGVKIRVNADADELNDPGNMMFWARANASTQRVIGDIGAAAGIDDGQWHLVVAWINPTTDNWVVYLDGVEQTVTHIRSDDLGTMQLDEFDTYVGAGNVKGTTDEYYTGDIGEFRFYHNTQSATLAQDLWDQFTAGSFVSESKVA